MAGQEPQLGVWAKGARDEQRLRKVARALIELAALQLAAEATQSPSSADEGAPGDSDREASEDAA